MSRNTVAILALVVAIACYLAGRYSAPTETVEVERIVEVEKVVERIVRDTVTVKEERPDGTVVTRTEAKERLDRDTSTARQSLSARSTKRSLPQWSLGVYRQLDDRYAYTVVVDRRILGNLSVGVYGRSDENLNGEFGVGLRVSF